MGEETKYDPWSLQQNDKPIYPTPILEYHISLTNKGKDAKRKKPLPKKTHLWAFDPSAFQPLPRAGFFKRHILGRVRSLGKYAIYTLAFSYPILLVSLGIIFGGVVFWSSLAVSVAIVWLIISESGYARNFADWGVGDKRFLGLFLAFGLVLAFWYGLTHLGFWFFPIFFGILVASLVVGVGRFAKL